MPPKAFSSSVDGLVVFVGGGVGGFGSSGFIVCMYACRYVFMSVLPEPS